MADPKVSWRVVDDIVDEIAEVKTCVIGLDLSAHCGVGRGIRLDGGKRGELVLYCNVV